MNPEQIKAALDEHIMVSGILCHCGWKVSHRSDRLIWPYSEQHRAHQAEVIAALLPEATETVEWGVTAREHDPALVAAMIRAMVSAGLTTENPDERLTHWRTSAAKSLLDAVADDIARAERERREKAEKYAAECAVATMKALDRIADEVVAERERVLAEVEALVEVWCDCGDFDGRPGDCASTPLINLVDRVRGGECQ